MIPPRSISPREYAKRHGISPDKVLTWIRSGELRALNLATNADGRPRLRITPTLHRIDAKLVIVEILRVGFELIKEENDPV